MKKISTLKKYSGLLFFLLCSFSILQATTKIMPLGNSITWDWHYDDPRTDAERSGYRNYLWYQLTDKGYDVDFVGSKTNGGAVKPYFDGDNEGYTGETSYQIADRVYHLLTMNPPDVVLLHIGTNDSLYYPSTSTTGVESILDEIDRFEKNKGVHIKVILARIIKLPSQSTWIRQFNNSIEEMARDRINRGDDIRIVDMENGAGIDYSSDLVDGIHPNDRGYEKMANVWFNALNSIFGTIPTNISASDGTLVSGVIINNYHISRADHYKIYRNGTYVGLTYAASYKDTKAYPGKYYNYTVRACNSYGCSAQSAPDKGWRASAIPTAPVNISATDGTLVSGVVIGSYYVSGATHYKFYRAASAYGTKRYLGLTANSSAKDTIAWPGYKYYYFVKACSSGGCSNYSAYNAGIRAVSTAQQL